MLQISILLLSSNNKDSKTSAIILPTFSKSPLFKPLDVAAGVPNLRPEVTFGADGSVKDVRVVQSEPKRMFDRNVIRAVLKWKFKPRIINGVAVERKAIQMLEFTLNDLN